MISIQQLVFSILIGIAVAYITHRLTSERDLKNRRREQRIDYLINAYQTFSSICNRKIDENHFEAVEKAVASIKLLGSSQQIQLIQEIEKNIADRVDIQLGNLLNNLRESLRKELGLERIEFVTPTFSLIRKDRVDS